MNIKFLKIRSYLNNEGIIIDSNIDNDFLVTGIASINNATNSHITFFNDSKFIDALKKTKAKGCLIKSKDIHNLPLTCHPIIVKDPYLSFAHLTNYFYPVKSSNGKIDSSSSINQDFLINSNVQIDQNVVIKENTYIDNFSIILNNTSIGPNVKIGKNTIVSPNNVLSNTIIGDNCLIQSGCVIGDRGFGFTIEDKVEIKHIGNVIIGNNVQIGSNTTIDRATLDSTIIGDNTRIDNLVQIAHNVVIGTSCIIAAQVGIAGSAVLGNNCLIGGQAGIAGHLKIGNNVTIAAKSGVTKNIDDNLTVAGFPAIDILKWKKNIIKQYKNI